MATGTFTTGTADGAITTGNATYSTARNATSGTLTGISTTTIPYAYSALDGIYFLQRGFFAFNISSIPVGNLITGGTLTLFGAGAASNNVDSSDIAVLESTQGSEVLQTTDYDNFNTTELTPRMNIASYGTTDGQANDFPLNASGIALANTAVGGTGFAGFVKFCIVNGKKDLDNSAPTTGYNDIVSYSGDNASNKPQLVLTYVPNQNGLQSKYW